MTPYPIWTATYSNEAFDRAQALAGALYRADVAAGIPAPADGYHATARRIVDDANAYGRVQCNLRAAGAPTPRPDTAILGLTWPLAD